MKQRLRGRQKQKIHFFYAANEVRLLYNFFLILKVSQYFPFTYMPAVQHQMFAYTKRDFV